MMKICLLFSLLIFVTGCSDAEQKEASKTDPVVQNKALIEEAKRLLQPGDLLLRTGTSYASEQIKELSQKDKNYSHAGVVVMDKGIIKVCSIEPVDEASRTDTIRYDAVTTFLSPKHNSGFGIYRYQLSGEERSKFLQRIQQYYNSGIAFDPVFNYGTDDKMYCSEMISKSLLYATDGKLDIEKTYITDPKKINSIKRHFRKHKIDETYIRTMPVVTLDALYTNPACQQVKGYTFAD